MESKQIVTITGISGYIGSQICLYFLNDGTFKVRGTVRNKLNEYKIDPLKLAFGEKFDSIELVEADLMNQESLFKAIEGSTYVIHVASPRPSVVPRNENELIIPAVEGTLSICRACQKYKVKRLVITSSVVTIMNTSDKSQTKFSVNDWSDPTDCKPYEKSKILQEKAAWDFQKSLPDDEKFEIVVLNQGAVIGPNLNKAQFQSGDIVKKIMLKGYPGMPKIQIAMVDVRDVAKAHFNAVTIKEAANKRFIVKSEDAWMSDLGQYLDEIYGENGSKKYQVVKKEIPRIILQIVSCFDKQTAYLNNYWGIKYEFEDSETKEILKMENYIPMKQSVQDMAISLIECGYIPDRR